MFSDLCSLLDRVIDWWSWRRPEIPSRLPLDGGPQRESAVKSVWAGSRLWSSRLVLHSAKHPARENTDSRTLSINCQSTALIVRTLFIALVLIPEIHSVLPNYHRHGPWGGEKRRKNTVFFEKRLLLHLFVWHQEKVIEILVCLMLVPFVSLPLSLEKWWVTWHPFSWRDFQTKSYSTVLIMRETLEMGLRWELMWIVMKGALLEWDQPGFQDWFCH